MTDDPARPTAAERYPDDPKLQACFQLGQLTTATELLIEALDEQTGRRSALVRDRIETARGLLAEIRPKAAA